MAGSSQESFEVEIYDPERLHILFHHEDHNSPFTIKEKDHIHFFKDYFGEPEGIDAKYIVIEKDYINRDYLHDYANYYSLCFKPYPKVCTRLHFFTGDHGSKEEFIEKFKTIIVEGIKKHETFWSDDYLGFIVIKPTPYSVIGYTLLKHFNFNKTKKPFDPHRSFWGTKEYKVHVFGNEVKLISLAFQEQDQALAACATIAIWCMLQRAAEDYYVILKSPGEITLDTGITDHQGNRLFPNKGLIVPDMCKAITKNGLVTEVRHASVMPKGEINLYLRKLIHAYSPMKIPILLGIDVPLKGEYYGHAVAICAHRIEDSSVPTKSKNAISKLIEYVIGSEKKINWVAERVNKFYAHDDQWGPFSKMEFDSVDKIISNWTRFSPGKEPTLPIAVIIPVYPKVRISYDDIEPVVLGIDKILISALEDNISGPIAWDIQLFPSEDFKTKIQTLEILDDSVPGDNSFKLQILSLNLPKYIWIATFKINDKDVIEFLFDATGLANSMLGLHIVNYFPELQKQLQVFLTNKLSDLQRVTEDNLSDEYINFLQEEMSSITFN